MTIQTPAVLEAVASPLAGKVALITGASSGIGAASARALAADGAEVVLLARRREQLEEVAESIRAAGGTAHALQCDISDEDAAIAAVTEASEIGGGLQILVHSAGLFEPVGVGDGAVASLDRMYRTNVRAPFAMTEAALPHLRGDGGSVVFISSVCAFTAFGEGTAYSATKGAVAAMVAGLAVELGPSGIRVNAIAPGEVQTPMNAQAYVADPSYLPRMIDATPLRMAAVPEDIGSIVAFLAGDGARFIHGTTIVADGGLTVSLPSAGRTRA
jgi:NAD(P)-dependent dehydrogenase (short-subunit alcohol dehydrogenase family)